MWEDRCIRVWRCWAFVWSTKQPGSRQGWDAYAEGRTLRRNIQNKTKHQTCDSDFRSDFGNHYNFMMSSCPYQDLQLMTISIGSLRLLAVKICNDIGNHIISNHGQLMIKMQDPEFTFSAWPTAWQGWHCDPSYLVGYYVALPSIKHPTT